MSPGDPDSRREYVVVLAAGALGAALVLLATGRPWVHAVVVGIPGEVRVSPSGRSVAPAVSGLGLFGLASVVAVVATRRAGRRIVGALAALSGLGILATTAQTAVDPEGAVHDAAVAAAGLTSPTVDDVAVTGWPVLAAVGALLIVFAGAASLLRGGRWPVMSGQYERRADANTSTGAAEARRYRQPGTSAATTEQDRSAPASHDHQRRDGPGQRRMWDALDRGEDPTD